MEQLFNHFASISSDHLKRIAEVLGYIIGLLCGFIWRETNVVNAKQNEDSYALPADERYRLKKEEKEKKREIENLGSKKEVPNTLNCPISQNIMRNPYIVVTCCHTFEKECLFNWLERNKNCPLCRLPIQFKDCKPNIALKSVIEDLKNEYKLD